MPTFAFSTGKIRFGAVGATLTDSDNIAAVQNVRFEHTFETAIVREGAHINNYPVANAQYDANAMLSFEATEIAGDLIPYITGAVASSAGGYNVYTASKTNKPAYLQLVFIGETEDGRVIEIAIPRCKITSLPLDFQRDGFVSPTLEATSFPNDTYVAFIIREEQ